MTKPIKSLNASELKCQVCGDRFKLKRSWQLFCSHSCRNIWHTAARDLAINLLKEIENDPQITFKGKDIVDKFTTLVDGKATAQRFVK